MRRAACGAIETHQRDASNLFGIDDGQFTSHLFWQQIRRPLDVTAECKKWNYLRTAFSHPDPAITSLTPASNTPIRCR